MSALKLRFIAITMLMILSLHLSSLYSQAFLGFKLISDPWEQVEKVNTPIAYDDYIINNPTSRHVNQAKTNSLKLQNTSVSVTETYGEAKTFKSNIDNYINSVLWCGKVENVSISIDISGKPLKLLYKLKDKMDLYPKYLYTGAEISLAISTKDLKANKTYTNNYSGKIEPPTYISGNPDSSSPDDAPFGTIILDLLPRILQSIASIFGPEILLKSFSDPDEKNNISSYASEALSSIGTMALEPLMVALASKDKNSREYSAITLGKIADARAAGALIVALQDNEKDVRQAAAHALVKLGGTWAAHGLSELLKTEV